jgi:hypothetical protein
MLLIDSNESNVLKTYSINAPIAILEEIIDIDVSELQFAHPTLICSYLL